MTSLLTAEELSVILNVTASTVEKLARTKQLPGKLVKRRYRFDLNAVLRCLRRLEGGAA